MADTKVLMVDDETEYTSITKLYLEDLGEYDVRIENRGSKALLAAVEFRPDIILLDISMPDMNGIDAAHQIREDPSLRNIPIVFFTGACDELGIDRKKETYEGFYYLTKPTSGEQLHLFIQKHVPR